MGQYNISFAGAGRVAGTLCMEMYRSGIKILQIISESASDGKTLADFCNASWSSDLIFNDLNDIIIVAVPDHKLEIVLSQIRCSEKTIVAHTAGSYGLDIFPARIKNAGVFYPLQTFSKNRNILFRDLPFLLEANGKNTGHMLKNLAESVGGKVNFVDSECRRMLHLSAVFVNNFTNFMLTAGNELVSQAGLSFRILEPLIKETISKAIENGPEVSQTGPAIRKDINTIKKHIELLSFSPELQKIYRELSDSIMEHYNADR
jgi:predicted short-subunit dehydrogenase-like oxidoreductase (DUF2520 family)